MKKKRKVIDYVEVPNSACRNCEYRKENWGPALTTECLECGFKEQRDAPYFAHIPVYEDDLEEDI